MLANMGKKKPQKPSQEQEKPPPLFVRIDWPLHNAMQAFIDSQPAAPDRTAVVVAALHLFLAKQGHWPPKDAK